MRAICIALFIIDMLTQAHASRKSLIIKTKKGKSYLAEAAGEKHDKEDAGTDYALG